MTPGFLPDFRCRSILYQISILCTGVSWNNERSQGEAPEAWCSLRFHRVAFFWPRQLLPLIVSIQGPLMTTERNAQCSCGPTWALQAGTLPPVVGSVFPEPVVGVMSEILNTCTPASWAFPPPPPHLPSASERQLLWPLKRGSPRDRTSPCLVSLAEPSLAESSSSVHSLLWFCHYV